MMKLDRLSIPVTDVDRSRAWYLGTLGLSVEFEVPDRQTVALQDGEGFTIFLQQAAMPAQPRVVAARHRVRARSAEDLLGLRGGAAGSRRLPDPALGRALHEGAVTAKCSLRRP